ncbi:MAG: type I-E CRISPR-associated protein Cse1/CasA [Candidatus Contendobacter sp.]|nr:type I-E CRISPR-associated protein Cse1/CasA [Candidatus Contendobacter sp.]
MNLINDPWIPVRCADGSSSRIRPHELTVADNPVVALDAPRPDFNGALAQFLIGLLQTVCAPANEEEWEDWLWSPPASDILAQRFAPLAPCFQLDGDGPRFMQEFDRTLDGKPIAFPASDLLIEAPKGVDLFVKYGTVHGLCLSCAAATLWTLQLNAPEGGRGHFTSLRGGGPLTTLVLFDSHALPKGELVVLWQDLWLNVLDRPAFISGATVSDDTPKQWFPWLSPRENGCGGKVSAADAHPATVFWAMPRRICFDFDIEAVGDCDVCGAGGVELITNCQSRPNGTKYEDWLHPLSPYYLNDKKVWLPSHPRGSFSYRWWPELVAGRPDRRIARVIESFHKRRLENVQFRVWAFGYDMDKNKPICWYEARLPLLDLTDEFKRLCLAGFAKQWVEAADEARKLLFFTLKQAWFKRPSDVKGDMSTIELAFWNDTEPAFYNGIRTFAESLEDNGDIQSLQQRLNEGWHTALTQQARSLFDQWATAGEWEYENPQRLANAYHMLRRGLHGNALKSKLGLAPPPDLDSKNRKGKKRKNP